MHYLCTVRVTVLRPHKMPSLAIVCPTLI